MNKIRKPSNLTMGGAITWLFLLLTEIFLVAMMILSAWSNMWDKATFTLLILLIVNVQMNKIDKEI